MGAVAQPKARAWREFAGPEGICTQCGARTLMVFRIQGAIKGDAQHSIPEARSEWMEHANDGTLAGRAYCERPVPERKP